MITVHHNIHLIVNLKLVSLLQENTYQMIQTYFGAKIFLPACVSTDMLDCTCHTWQSKANAKFG